MGRCQFPALINITLLKYEIRKQNEILNEFILPVAHKTTSQVVDFP